jgi:hypothetical protein
MEDNVYLASAEGIRSCGWAANQRSMLSKGREVRGPWPEGMPSARIELPRRSTAHHLGSIQVAALPSPKLETKAKLLVISACGGGYE